MKSPFVEVSMLLESKFRPLAHYLEKLLEKPRDSRRMVTRNVTEQLDNNYTDLSGLKDVDPLRMSPISDVHKK